MAKSALREPFDQLHILLPTADVPEGLAGALPGPYRSRDHIRACFLECISHHISSLYDIRLYMIYRIQRDPTIPI